MAAPTAPFENGDLERYTLYNIAGTNDLDFRTVVFLDKGNDGGMVRGDHADAGEIAGVLEETGAPVGGSMALSVIPTTTVPVNQGGRVRYRGMAKIRTTNVACVRGTKAYVIKATGKVTNTDNSGANPQIGVFMRSTGGTADELAVVSLRFN
jgi:hypothetical protein